MAATDDGAGQGVLAKTLSVDGAGNKTFEMQTREVDAVKAVTPLAAKPNFTNRPTDNLNGGNFDVGKPNPDQPYKGKRKPFKNNKPTNTKKNSPNEQPDSSSAVPLKASFEQQQFSRGGVDTAAGAVAMNSRKFSNKWRNDNSDWSSQGKSHGGANGRGNFNSKNRGGGPVRPHRSNTFDDERTPGHSNYHNNDGFRSVRGDPRGHFDEQMASKANITRNDPTKHMINNIANDGLARHHLPTFDEPTQDVFGHHSPSGLWHPHMQPSYGPPPTLTQTQATIPPPPAMGVLIPMPFAPPQQGQALARAQESAHPHPSVTNKDANPVTAGGNEHPRIDNGIPVFNTAPALTETPDVTTPKINSPLYNPSTAVTSSICDPRPAHMRIEGLMTTIVGELQHLKLRITPGVGHKLSAFDMARYLDTCMDLCKLVSGASAELSKENVALLSRVESVPGMAAAPTNSVVRRGGVMSAGPKIGSCQHQPQQNLSSELAIKSVNAKDVNFDQRKEQVSNSAGHALPTYTLPSGAQTHFIPLIPTYAGYCINGTPDVELDSNSNIEHTTSGQPWWVQKQQHEFLESEKERLKLSFEDKEAVKAAAMDGAKEAAKGG